MSGLARTLLAVLAIGGAVAYLGFDRIPGAADKPVPPAGPPGGDGGTGGWSEPQALCRADAPGPATHALLPLPFADGRPYNVCVTLDENRNGRADDRERVRLSRGFTVRSDDTGGWAEMATWIAGRMADPRAGDYLIQFRTDGGMAAHACYVHRALLARMGRGDTIAAALGNVTAEELGVGQEPGRTAKTPPPSPPQLRVVSVSDYAYRGLNGGGTPNGTTVWGGRQSGGGSNRGTASSSAGIRVRPSDGAIKQVSGTKEVARQPERRAEKQPEKQAAPAKRSAGPRNQPDRQAKEPNRPERRVR